MTATEVAPDPAPAGSGPLLELRGLEKRFGPVRALRGVNLEVPAAQVTALVGDNGAGKSVLIRTVSGIHAPDGGEILWQGRPAAHPHPARGVRAGHRDRVPGSRAR